MTDRANPMIWMNEPEPEGVFIGAGEDGLRLLGLPQGPAPAARRRELERLRSQTVSASARARLAEMAQALADSAQDGAFRRIALDDLGPDDLALALDVLGTGEASAMIATPSGMAQAIETVFPGLWLMRMDDAPNAPWAEIADCPSLVRETLALMPARTMPLEHIVPPDGAMNVMGVLAEVRHVAAAWTPGACNHVMNFTLLPMTEVDASFLAAMLGEGPVRFASGGYGAARIIATAFARVWAVQYLNSMGAVILDTLEIGDVPIAARAAREDFADSAVRLTHILAGDLQ
jgi:hydrogenase-1 operon protein HyaF